MDSATRETIRPALPTTIPIVVARSAAAIAARASSSAVCATWLSGNAAWSAAILRAGMEDPDDPVFLSTLKVELERDAPSARILRSVLMKPEHEPSADWLANRVERLAARTRPGG